MNTRDRYLQLAGEWGWEVPDASVLDAAACAIRWEQMRSGDILVESNLLSRAEVDALIDSKPDNIKTMEWVSSKVPKVRGYVERILTLKKGFAFYESLTNLAEHSANSEPLVARRAGELDAALMTIEGKVPVLVFSDWDRLLTYMNASVESRANDPIRKALGESAAGLKLAVSRREEVSVVINSAGSENAGGGASDGDHLWIGGNGQLPEQQELSRLIDQAISMDATDIALVPMRDGRIQVLARRYGDLVHLRGKSRILDPEMAISAIKYLGQKSGANPTATKMTSPSDGQITYRSTAGEVFLRLSFIPLQHPGERRDLISVSMRLLPRVEKNVSVVDLKLRQQVIDEIELAMQMGNGFILIAGPTNSGKSTTVAGAVGLHVNRYGDTRKRISVEDPIERFVFGMTQVNAKHRSTRERLESDDRFAVILRAIKRHDPDVINVGEIRDLATANLCVSSATSGHLVLSTIHANDSIMSADVLARMIDPSLSFQLMESLSLILSQRLVKTLCPHCKESRPTNDTDRKLWKRYSEMVGDEGDLPDMLCVPKVGGCEHSNCDNGYAGITPVNEVLPFTRKAKNIAARMLTDPTVRSELAALRTVKLLDECLLLLKEGRADLDSVLV